MTLRDTFLSFIRALISIIGGIGAALTFAAYLQAKGVAVGFWPVFIVFGCTALLIKWVLDRQARD